jgi:hypothetical protein
MTRYGAQFGPDIGLAARRHGISHDPAGPLLEGR